MLLGFILTSVGQPYNPSFYSGTYDNQLHDPSGGNTYEIRLAVVWSGPMPYMHSNVYPSGSPFAGTDIGFIHTSPSVESVTDTAIVVYLDNNNINCPNYGMPCEDGSHAALTPAWASKFNISSTHSLKVTTTIKIFGVPFSSHSYINNVGISNMTRYYINGVQF